jgi:hypothetical protein
VYGQTSSASARASSHSFFPALAALRFEYKTWFLGSRAIACVNSSIALSYSLAANALFPWSFKAYEEEVVEQMNLTSKTIPPTESEFELAGLTPIPSIKIKPPRVKESLVTMECEMVHHYFLEDHKNGGACVIIGRVVMFHVDESVLLDDFKINLEVYKPVARLAGANYSKLGEIFSIKRPLI